MTASTESKKAPQETKAKLVSRKEVQTTKPAVPEGLKDHPTVAIIEAASQDLSQELDIVVSSSANLINSQSCFGGEG